MSLNVIVEFLCLGTAEKNRVIFFFFLNSCKAEQKFEIVNSLVGIMCFQVLSLLLLRINQGSSGLQLLWVKG